MHRPINQHVKLRSAGAYAALLAGGVAIFLLVRALGDSLVAPVPAASHATLGPASAAVPAVPSVLLQLLVALIAVIVTGHLLGRVLRSMGQPPVIGEILGGILL